MTRGKVAILSWVFGLAACAGELPAYEPLATSKAAMGYAEERLGNDSFRVSFWGVARTRVAGLERLALRRAAEIALQTDHRWSAVIDRSINRGIYAVSSRDGRRIITYRGAYRDWRRYWHLQCLARRWDHCDEDPLWFSSSRPGDAERVEVILTIKLLSTPLPRFPAPIDAQPLIERQAEPEHR